MKRKKSLNNILPRRQSIKQIISQRKSSRALRTKESNAKNYDNSPPLLDNRNEVLQSTLKLKRKDLIKCWNIFREYDVHGRGYFTLHGFMLDVVVDEPLTAFIETIFELSDVIDLNHIEYGPLFYTLVSYCMFEVSKNESFGIHTL